MNTQQPTRRNSTCGLCDERGHNCRTCKNPILIVALNNAIEFSESCIARIADEGIIHARQILKNWLFAHDSSVIGGIRRQIMSVLAVRLSLVTSIRAEYTLDTLCGYLFTCRSREMLSTNYTTIPQREILLRNDVLMNSQFQFEMFISSVEIYTNLRNRYLNSDVIGRRMIVAQINLVLDDNEHDTRTRWYRLFLNWVDRRRVHPRIVPVVLFPDDEVVPPVPALTVNRREPDASKIDFECVICYETKCFCESVVFNCKHEMCVSCFDMYVSVTLASQLKCALCREPLVAVSREIGK